MALRKGQENWSRYLELGEGEDPDDVCVPHFGGHLRHKRFQARWTLVECGMRLLEWVSEHGAFHFRFWTLQGNSPTCMLTQFSMCSTLFLIAKIIMGSWTWAQVDFHYHHPGSSFHPLSPKASLHWALSYIPSAFWLLEPIYWGLTPQNWPITFILFLVFSFD